MVDKNIEQLKRVIECQHGGSAAFSKSLRVSNATKYLTEWDGIVHLFDVKGNPKSKRAYAWTSSIKGGTKPRFFAVLHTDRVTGPAQAVKAAATAIRNSGKRATSA